MGVQAAQMQGVVAVLVDLEPAQGFLLQPELAIRLPWVRVVLAELVLVVLKAPVLFFLPLLLLAVVLVGIKL